MDCDRQTDEGVSAKREEGSERLRAKECDLKEALAQQITIAKEKCQQVRSLKDDIAVLEQRIREQDQFQDRQKAELLEEKWQRDTLQSRAYDSEKRVEELEMTLQQAFALVRIFAMILDLARVAYFAAFSCM